MFAERDLLSRVVMPALNKRLEPHKVHVELIDPRWGKFREKDEVHVGPCTAGVLEMSLRAVMDSDIVIHLAGAKYGRQMGHIVHQSNKASRPPSPWGGVARSAGSAV